VEVYFVEPGAALLAYLPATWDYGREFAFVSHAWAERAKTVGYPERYAQEALGHKSKAVHRA